MKKLVIWICNGVVALMALLAILCYFFAPVLKLKVKYPLTADQIEDMVASSVSDYDIKIDQGADIRIDLNIDMGLLFSSIGSDGEVVVQKLIDKNVTSLARQLKGTIGDITKSVAKQYAKEVVREQVHTQLKNYLNTEDANRITQKLEAAGIGDEYIAEKTDEIFDLILGGAVSVDRIGDEVLKTVDDVYAKLKASGDQELSGMELSESDRTKIKNTVTEKLGDFSAADGTINFEEYVNNFLADALHDMNSAKAGGVVPLSAAPQTESDDQLTQEIGKVISDAIPSEIAPILSIAFLVILLLVILSMLAWVYILVKLIVKLAKFSTAEPTVRLKLPIILGWLPFLFLVIAPSIAMPLVSGMLGEELAGLAISFSSIGWIALMSAIVCIGISIFYIIARKKGWTGAVAAAQTGEAGEAVDAGTSSASDAVDSYAISSTESSEEESGEESDRDE